MCLENGPNDEEEAAHADSRNEERQFSAKGLDTEEDEDSSSDNLLQTGVSLSR